MPSILAEKYKQSRSEKEEIEKRVLGGHIRATEEEQKAAKQIMERVSSEFSREISSGGTDMAAPRIRTFVRSVCQSMGDLTYEQQLRLEQIVLATVLGNGPIEEFIQDPEVTEIVVQRYDNIAIEKHGKVFKTEAVFNNEEHLQTIIRRIVQSCNREINTSKPIVDARLKDGSRVNATIPPVSADGATLTIRKFSQKKLTGKDYMDAGSLDNRMLYFLERCVVGKVNIFVSGGTGSGKTTLLNMLSQFIPEDELIITIEDTLELKLQQPNVRRMEIRLSSNKDMMNVDQKALVKAALRQRPDRIILGETRDGSVVDLISAMSTGHEGSMSTIHANSPQNMCDVRIPILYTMNEDANFSEKSIAMQIAEAIQLIVQISRFPDGSRKISEIAYVKGLTPDYKVETEDLFYYDREEKRFRACGVKPQKILEKIRLLGLDFEESVFDED